MYLTTANRISRVSELLAPAELLVYPPTSANPIKNHLAAKITIEITFVTITRKPSGAQKTEKGTYSIGDVRSVSDIGVLNHKTVVAVGKRPGSTETNLGAADTKALTLAGLKEEGWKDTTVEGLVGQDGGVFIVVYGILALSFPNTETAGILTLIVDFSLLFN
ncbi:uncharacterized protein K444DRAFT_634127 [Hyaloscypha bicolor E]|uniref:Uncharacterized protein n=1 Tax=Hyaloscypha bicolor E TaxID=1095630 RepID=A0A2J6SX24_9HELO|nr:uncharacterized protein K444DRAFT_634127 [Hyaloscypha bicolor E]PMD55291.1 hypothetical protein K444DRAFT_634127 [Hyaloscypha bicolor E]